MTSPGGWLSWRILMGANYCNITNLLLLLLYFVAIIYHLISHLFGLIPFFFWPHLQYITKIVCHIFKNHQNSVAHFLSPFFFTTLIFFITKILVPFLYHQDHCSSWTKGCGKTTTKSPNFCLFHQHCVNQR